MQTNVEQEQRLANPPDALAASKAAMSELPPEKARGTPCDSSAPPPPPRFEELQKTFPGPYEPT
jgi:hypothetical protein